jgi:PAS domain S-box-containing protein
VSSQDDRAAAEDARQALEAAQERFRLVFDKSLDVLLIVDGATGTVLEANEGLTRGLGYEKDEVTGRHVSSLFAVDPDASSADLMARTHAYGWVFESQRFRRADGSACPMDVTANLVRWGDDKAILLSLRDVSEREAAKRERDELRERLSFLIEYLPEGVVLLDGRYRILVLNPAADEALSALGDRTEQGTLRTLGGQPIASVQVSAKTGGTHELVCPGPPRRVFETSARSLPSGSDGDVHVFLLREVTGQLEARRRLREQERLASLGQLAAGIAHDFNNLLMIIMGHVQLARSRYDLPQGCRELLDVVSEQGHRGSKLVRQIVDFSRKSPAPRIRLDLVPLTKEVAKLLHCALPEHIDLQFVCELNECVVRGDLVQIQQVLTNLAVNARDAMPEGGQMEIRLEPGRPEQPPAGGWPEGSGGRWAHLTVRDTGVGIEPENMPHVFEPFFTTKGVGKGTGLGLSQVYGIVKRHQGVLDVQSTPGEGPTFHVYLPLVEGRTPKQRAGGRAPHGSGETILVVEDEPLVLYVLREVLTGLGYRVLATQDSGEAAGLFTAHADEVALLVTDAVMPGMGGPELMRRLRKMRPDLPTVILTGHPLGTDVGTAVQTEGVLLLQKPVEPQDLAVAVREALGTEDAGH